MDADYFFPREVLQTIGASDIQALCVLTPHTRTIYPSAEVLSVIAQPPESTCTAVFDLCGQELDEDSLDAHIQLGAWLKEGGIEGSALRSALHDLKVVGLADHDSSFLVFSCGKGQQVFTEAFLCMPEGEQFMQGKHFENFSLLPSPDWESGTDILTTEQRMDLQYREGVLALCHHILRSVHLFEYILPQLAAAAAATFGSDAGHLLPKQISNAVCICTNVFRGHPDQQQALQDLQDILEKPVPDEEDEELVSKHPDELEVGLYDNHHVVKQTDSPVQTLGDIGCDAADGLSAELSLADDLHAFSFATEDADQQEHQAGQGLQLDPSTHPAAAYEAFSFKPMLSSTGEPVFCVPKHNLGDAPVSPSALSHQVPSVDAAVAGTKTEEADHEEGLATASLKDFGQAGAGGSNGAHEGQGDMGMWGPAFLEHGDDAALPGYPRLWSAVKQLGGLPPIGPGHKVTGNPKASLPSAPLAAVSSMQPWGCEADMAGGHASCISTLIRGGAAEDTVSNSAAPMSPQHSAYSIAERSAAAVTGQTALPSGMGSGLPQPAALPTQANGQEKREAQQLGFDAWDRQATAHQHRDNPWGARLGLASAPVPNNSRDRAPTVHKAEISFSVTDLTK